MRSSRTASDGSFRLVATIGAVVTFALAGAAFAIAAPSGTGGLNNGGKSTSGGHSSCYTDTGPSAFCSHNPTEQTKPCTTGGGNGCHALPDTPCDRGQSGVQLHNKHCGPSELTSTPPTTPTPTTTPTGTVTTPTGATTTTAGSTSPGGGSSSTKATTKNNHPSGAESGGSKTPSRGGSETETPAGSETPSSESEGSESSTPSATPAEAVTQTASFTG